MNILIVDAKSTENYDYKYIENNSIGGIETTVLGISRELAKNHKVYLSQLNRSERYEENGVTYIHSKYSLNQDEFIPDIVIILRKYRLLKNYSKAYPKAKFFVWAHNFQHYDILARRHWIIKTQAKVICISKCHRDYIDNIFNGPWSWLFRLFKLSFNKVPVAHIYYAVDKDFYPDQSIKIDHNKLLFLSTANKGLDMVLRHFKEVLKKAPDYKLYIAGTTTEGIEKYNLDRELLRSPSVKLIGRLNKFEVIKHLRDSFCVFYPQNTHPETFGRIYIEANCVGTPVLAHPFGSMCEVVDNTEQFVDAANSKAVVSKLLDWKENGRPHVECKKDFQIEHIMKRWSEVLGLDQPSGK